MAESCVTSAESLMHCTECNRELPSESIVILYFAVYNYQFSACESCSGILQALPPTQCPECKQSLQVNATHACCAAYDTPEASSGEQLITTNDRCSSFPDLHPLAEVEYSPGKDELVCHNIMQFTTSVDQTVDNSPDALVQVIDKQAAELEMQQHSTTSLLQPVLKQFYSLQPSDFPSQSL